MNQLAWAKCKIMALIDGDIVQWQSGIERKKDEVIAPSGRNIEIAELMRTIPYHTVRSKYSRRHVERPLSHMEYGYGVQSDSSKAIN